MRSHTSRNPWQAKTHTWQVDVTAGADANSGNAVAPIQTTTKVNALALRPGDRVLFKRGETWRGTGVSAPASGRPGRPIMFGAYGSGARPILDGTYDATGWALHAGAIYDKDLSGTWVSPNQVFEDGVRLTYVAAYGDMVAGSYFWDNSVGNLYIWCTDGADPDTHTISLPETYTHCFNSNSKAHLDVRSIHALRGYYAGFYFREMPASRDIVLTDCYSSWQAQRGYDMGDYVVEGLSDITFEGCVAADCMGEGWHLSNGTRLKAINCQVLNGAADHAKDGIPSNSGGMIIGIRSVDCEIRNCYVEAIYGTGLQTEQEPGYARPLRAKFYTNEVQGSPLSGDAGDCFVDEGTDTICQGNTFTNDASDYNVEIRDGSDNCHFMSNTVIGAAAWMFITDGCTNLSVYGNSFTLSTYTAFVNFLNAGDVVGLYIDYNYYAQKSGNVWRWHTGDYASTLAQWRTLTGQEANSTWS